MYGSYFQFEFERPDRDSFEMRVSRCRFRVLTTDDPLAEYEDVLPQRCVEGGP